MKVHYKLFLSNGLRRTAGLSLERMLFSHAPHAHVYHRVDRCLRLVDQPPGLSSCHLIGMNIVFFNMVLPKIRLLHLLPGAFKSPLKSQTFVQIQG